MNNTRPKPTPSKLPLREPAKPLAQPETRPLRPDHPAAEIYRLAQEELSGRPQEISLDAHEKDSGTPTASEGGRPPAESVDAKPENVDANASTIIPPVDANASTLLKRGRPRKLSVGAHKKDRHGEGQVRQHFRLPPQIDETFRLFRAKHNLELQEFYQLAGAHFIECVDAHKNISVDALASNDDRRKMILFKTHPRIIELYLKYNPENRWKPADDLEGQRYNDADVRDVELGIIQTQFNAGFKRVHSFKYYTTEIDVALAAPMSDELTDSLLAHHRRSWERARGGK